MAYTALMCACFFLALILWFSDERVIREVNVWAKPMKFMSSTALLALTTAIFLALLPLAVRAKRALQVLVWVLILTSAFEVGYITWQAAWGNASHYNVTTPFLAVMFGIMAIAAVALTATQGYLAWIVIKHGLSFGGELFKQAAAIGLALTFVLATVSGFMLGSLQPPAGEGLPLVGWHLTGGDVRPAHFLGVHANQLIPLAALTLVYSQKHGLSHLIAIRTLYVGVIVYVLIWSWLCVLGMTPSQ